MAAHAIYMPSFVYFFSSTLTLSNSVATSVASGVAAAAQNANVIET